MTTLGLDVELDENGEPVVETLAATRFAPNTPTQLRWTEYNAETVRRIYEAKPVNKRSDFEQAVLDGRPWEPRRNKRREEIAWREANWPEYVKRVERGQPNLANGEETT